jgi:hypothetical protein
VPAALTPSMRFGHFAEMKIGCSSVLEPDSMYRAAINRDDDLGFPEHGRIPVNEFTTRSLYTRRHRKDAAPRQAEIKLR